MNGLNKLSITRLLVIYYKMMVPLMEQSHEILKPFKLEHIQAYAK